MAAVITAMRTSGVAPCYINFHALASTLSAGTKFTATYYWDFGDPAGIENLMTGPVAGHCFEFAGSYVVALSIRDEAGVIHTTSVTITVTAFAGTTHYVANEGNDTTGNGSIGNPWRSLYKAMNVMVAAVPNDTPANWQILLKRGQTHTIPAGTPNHNSLHGKLGPVIISAYDTGAKPIVLDQRPLTDLATTQVGGRISGWSWVDIDWRATYDPVAGNYQVGLSPFFLVLDMIGGPYTRADLLWLRCDISNYGQALLIQVDSPGAQAENISKCGNIGIVSCTATNIASVGMYLFFNDSSFINSSILGCDESHCLRVALGRRMAIWKATCLDASRRSGAGRHALKLHGYGVGQPTANSWGRTEDVYITGGRYRGATYVVTVAPQDTSAVQEVSNVVMDGASIEADISGLQPNRTVYSVITFGHDIYFRNCNVEIGPNAYAFNIEDYGTATVPLNDNIHYYNNTARAQQGAAFGTAFLRPFNLNPAARVYVRNNVCYASSGTVMLANFAVTYNPSSISDSGNVVHPANAAYVYGNGTLVSFLSWQSQGHAIGSINNIDPLFLLPADPKDARITNTSPLLNLPGLSHIAGVARDILGAARLGPVTPGAHQREESYSPPAPGLTAVTGAVTVSVDRSRSNNEASIDIERSLVTPTSFSVVGSVSGGEGTTTFDDTTVVGGQNYRYRLRPKTSFATALYPSAESTVTSQTFSIQASRSSAYPCFLSATAGFTLGVSEVAGSSGRADTCYYRWRWTDASGSYVYRGPVLRLRAKSPNVLSNYTFSVKVDALDYDGTVRASANVPLTINSVVTNEAWVVGKSGAAITAATVTQTKTRYANESTGSDTTGDGTSGNPYKTLAKLIEAEALDHQVWFLGPAIYNWDRTGSAIRCNLTARTDIEITTTDPAQPAILQETTRGPSNTIAIAGGNDIRLANIWFSGASGASAAYVNDLSPVAFGSGVYGAADARIATHLTVFDAVIEKQAVGVWATSTTGLYLHNVEIRDCGRHAVYADSALRFASAGSCLFRNTNREVIRAFSPKYVVVDSCTFTDHSPNATGYALIRLAGGAPDGTAAVRMNTNSFNHRLGEWVQITRCTFNGGDPTGSPSGPLGVLLEGNTDVTGSGTGGITDTPCMMQLTWIEDNRFNKIFYHSILGINGHDIAGTSSANRITFRNNVLALDLAGAGISTDPNHELLRLRSHLREVTIAGNTLVYLTSNSQSNPRYALVLRTTFDTQKFAGLTTVYDTCRIKANLIVSNGLLGGWTTGYTTWGSQVFMQNNAFRLANEYSLATSVGTQIFGRNLTTRHDFTVYQGYGHDTLATFDLWGFSLEAELVRATWEPTISSELRGLIAESMPELRYDLNGKIRPGASAGSSTTPGALDVGTNEEQPDPGNVTILATELSASAGVRTVSLSYSVVLPTVPLPVSTGALNPVVSAGVTHSTTALSATAAATNPTLALGAGHQAAALTASSALPATTTVTGSTIGAAALSSASALSAATLGYAFTISVSAETASGALPAATVGLGTTASATTLPLTGAIPAATVSGVASFAASVLTAAGGVPNPVVSTSSAGNIVITAGGLSAAFALNTPTLGIAWTQSAATLSVTGAAADPTLSLGWSIQASALSVSGAVLGATTSTGFTHSATALSATGALLVAGNALGFTFSAAILTAAGSVLDATEQGGVTFSATALASATTLPSTSIQSNQVLSAQPLSIGIIIGFSGVGQGNGIPVDVITGSTALLSTGVLLGLPILPVPLSAGLTLPGVQVAQSINISAQPFALATSLPAIGYIRNVWDTYTKEELLRLFPYLPEGVFEVVWRATP